jgi:hypothetical protein
MSPPTGVNQAEDNLVIDPRLAGEDEDTVLLDEAGRVPTRGDVYAAAALRDLDDRTWFESECIPQRLWDDDAA